MKTLDGKTLEKLHKLGRVLNAFRMLDTDMTIGECISLIQIANGMTDDGSGITVTELSTACDFPLSSTSRYTIKLAGKAKGGDGSNALISNNRSPTSDRTKELRLTPRGKLLIEQLTAMID
jgi:hypothetical protein